MTFGSLQPRDFPLVAVGQFVYRQGWSSPIIGPVDMHLAADLALRLNRDHATVSGIAARAYHTGPVTGFGMFQAQGDGDE